MMNQNSPLVFKKHSEFVRVGRVGSRAKTQNIISICMKRSPADPVIVGYTASKKTGNAVARNLAKRRLRHLVRLTQSEFQTGFCFVFIATSNTKCCDFSILLSDFTYCIRKSMERANV